MLEKCINDAEAVEDEVWIGIITIYFAKNCIALLKYNLFNLTPYIISKISKNVVHLGVPAVCCC